MRLLGLRSRTSNPRLPVPDRRSHIWRSPLLCSAAATAAVAGLAVAAAHSPLLQVRSVVWTGPVRLAGGDYLALESASLGRPLLLLGERGLRSTLHVDGATVRLRLRRHLPHTLEVRVEPRRAVACLEDGTPVDDRGRVLQAEHASPGLPHLVGFALLPDGRRLEPRARSMLRRVRDLLDSPALAPERVSVRDGEMELLLADSGCRVRLQADRLDSQLLKLRILQQSLGSEPLPAAVDLRFHDQIVVRGVRGEAHASRSQH